jgi:hypothetical protein
MNTQLLVNEEAFNNELEMQKAYPRTKSYRFKIARRSDNKYLGKWRGVNIVLRSTIN